MFGAGLLLGVVGASALFAPPELANQPAPWDRTAQESGPAAAATHAAGAGPAQSPQATPVAVQASAAASAAPAVTATQALAVASQPAPASMGAAPASMAPASLQAQSAAAPAGAAPASRAPEQVAKSEPVAKPHAATESHRRESRKAESASRHAVEPTDTTAREADAQAQPETERTARSEPRAPRSRHIAQSRSDSADEDSASGEDVVLPPPMTPRLDTFSAPPATATGDPTASGDPGSGDSSQ